MVRRHPWVFGGEKINSTEEGEALWARIKMQGKGQNLDKFIVNRYK